MNRLNITVILASGLLTTALLTSNSDSAQIDTDLGRSINEPVHRGLGGTLKGSSMSDNSTANTPNKNQTSYETKNGDDTLLSG